MRGVNCSIYSEDQRNSRCVADCCRCCEYRTRNLGFQDHVPSLIPWEDITPFRHEGEVTVVLLQRNSPCRQLCLKGSANPIPNNHQRNIPNAQRNERRLHLRHHLLSRNSRAPIMRSEIRLPKPTCVMFLLCVSRLRYSSLLPTRRCLPGGGFSTHFYDFGRHS